MVVAIKANIKGFTCAVVSFIHNHNHITGLKNTISDCVTEAMFQIINNSIFSNHFVLNIILYFYNHKR